MLRPGRGTVRLFGLDPVAQAEAAKLQVGYLAEDQAYPPALRPSELFRFFASCYPTWDWDFADSLVRRFRIPVNRRLSGMSKGEQRQAGLVCAVAHRPKLLILDEPGGGLDPVVRRSFLEEVIELLSTQDRTVLFSSHHLQEVERIATRIGILDGGRKLLEEETDRLKEGSCRVLVELGETNEDRIRSSLSGCVQAAKTEGGWKLTLLCSELEAKERVARLLDGRVRDSRPLSLEDLFLSLVS
jgi:ABC-2 type transport system ATP-binding protein